MTARNLRTATRLSLLIAALALFGPCPALLAGETDAGEDVAALFGIPRDRDEEGAPMAPLSPEYLDRCRAFLEKSCESLPVPLPPSRIRVKDVVGEFVRTLDWMRGKVLEQELTAENAELRAKELEDRVRALEKRLAEAGEESGAAEEMTEVRKVTDAKLCVKSLRQIYAALLDYRQKVGKNERFPPHGGRRFVLELCLQRLLADPNALLCPATGRSYGETGFDDSPEMMTDYWGIANQKGSSHAVDALLAKGMGQSEIPLVWDAKPHPGGTYHVLFLDGHVEALDEADFQERIAKFGRRGG